MWFRIYSLLTIRNINKLILKKSNVLFILVVLNDRTYKKWTSLHSFLRNGNLLYYSLFFLSKTFKNSSALTRIFRQYIQTNKLRLDKNVKTFWVMMKEAALKFSNFF